MALHFSSSKRRINCFTDLDPGLTQKECSMTSPMDAPHVGGFPREDVLFHAEKVDECAFLFQE